MTKLLKISTFINEDAFEWNDEKATPNWRAHGVAFHQAVKAFRDPFGVERIDDRENYGEERINLLGVCDGVILHVTPYRARRTHSADLSPAGGKYEREDHYRENSF